jgi:hypothetical protein
VILLDTNVLIYASTPRSPLLGWARGVIAEGVSGQGAATSVVSIAEICVGDAEPHTVSDRIRRWGVAILDLPAAAAEPCARAYRAYRRRRAGSGREAPATPLPDFFIGAHAEVMGWAVATADPARFRTYFPSVRLETP